MKKLTASLLGLAVGTALVILPSISAHAGTGLNCNTGALNWGNFTIGMKETNSSNHRRGVDGDVQVVASPLCTYVGGDPEHPEADAMVQLACGCSGSSYTGESDLIEVQHQDNLNGDGPRLYWQWNDGASAGIESYHYDSISVGQTYDFDIDLRPVGSDYYAHLVVGGVDEGNGLTCNNACGGIDWQSWPTAFPEVLDKVNSFQSDVMGNATDHEDFSSLQERLTNGTWNNIDLTNSAWITTQTTQCLDASGTFAKKTITSSTHLKTWNDIDAPHTSCD